MLKSSTKFQIIYLIKLYFIGKVSQLLILSVIKIIYTILLIMCFPCFVIFFRLQASFYYVKDVIICLVFVNPQMIGASYVSKLNKVSTDSIYSRLYYMQNAHHFIDS